MKLTRNSLIVVTVTSFAIGVVGVIADLASLATVVLMAAFLGVSVLILRDEKPQPAASAASGPAVHIEPTPDPPSPSSQAIYDVRLPSASADYEFSFSASIYWTPVGPPSRHTDLGSVAVNAVLQRARRSLLSSEPTEEAHAVHQLKAAIGHPEADDRQQVRSWAEDIQLRLPGPHAAHFQMRSELRRQQEIADLQRQLERDVRQYLHEDALATAGSATVWWLAKHPEQIEQCVELYETLKRLSNAANDRLETGAETSPDWPQLTSKPSEITEDVAYPVVPQDPSQAVRIDLRPAMETFLDGHDSAERAFKAFALANLEEKFNRPDRAERIRSLFGSELTADDAGRPDDSSEAAAADSVPGDIADATTPMPSTAGTDSAASAGPASSTALSAPALAANGQRSLIADEPNSSQTTESATTSEPYREEFYSAAGDEHGPIQPRTEPVNGDEPTGARADG
ncbi:hypothetical protein ACIBL3_37250 [Kribbella sp. NPDC050124]|uniref:hypothetical protein n=1 Tax=Kribbella sp. NPDC050124 TaxID=3364114 RepID=UPI0037B6330C